MRRFAEEHGVVKVDALNCVDCILGGKGKFLKADPNHDFMFFGPGMMEFFKHSKEMMMRENVSEDAIKSLFGALRGIVYLDTLETATTSNWMWKSWTLDCRFWR
jgi:hypothetical protein